MKNLILFTNEFPYGSWEPYLETEIKYYGKFEHVYIVSLQLRKEHAKSIRNVPSYVSVIPIFYAKRMTYLLNSLRVLFNADLYNELLELFKNKKLNFINIVSLFIYLSRSDYEARKIIKLIPIDKLNNALFYSYRFEYQPYIPILINRWLGIHNKIISRAHRYDLYEDKRANGYIPLRKKLLKELYKVFPCSLNGVDYLINCYSDFKNRIEVAYLGTVDYGANNYTKSEEFRIVSCSNVVPVKRVNLLLESLLLITNHDITWTHFGDGPLLDRIEEEAKKLPGNIKVLFKGNVANGQLMNYYKNNCFDLFINLSTSEGIPVSIMEAMSFGIPILATNAGGTAELVKDGICGTVIPVDSKPSDIALNITKFITMDTRQYHEMRKSSRSIWKDMFCAESNYIHFFSKLD